MAIFFFSLSGIFAWDTCSGTSCVGRCGEKYKSEDSTNLCACDELCPMFRDCCRDYPDECNHNNQLPAFIYNRGNFKCLRISESEVKSLSYYLSDDILIFLKDAHLSRKL